MPHVRELIKSARHANGLTITEAAHLTGTSRPTFSHYENGVKAPNASTLERILLQLGYELDTVKKPAFTTHYGKYGKPFYVPDTLPTLAPQQARRKVELPNRLAWSGQNRARNLANKEDRKFVYQVVLEEGTPADILDFIDGTLLADLWDELPIAPHIQKEWGHLLGAS